MKIFIFFTSLLSLLIFLPVGVSAKEIFKESFETLQDIKNNGGTIKSQLPEDKIIFENGVDGKAVYLSGAQGESSSIKYENFRARSNQGTMEFWYKQRSRWDYVSPGGLNAGGVLELGDIGNPNTLGFFYNSPMNGFILELKGPDWRFNQAWAPLNFVKENEWHYIVGQWKCNSPENFIKIFLDGKLRDTKIELCPVFDISNQYMGLGRTGWYGQGGGVFDELRIYDHLKTSEEIQTDYEQRKTSLIHCQNNNDCGSSLSLEEQYCSIDLYKDREDFSCLNPATVEARCKSTIVPEMIDKCQISCTRHLTQDQCHGLIVNTGFENEADLGQYTKVEIWPLFFEPGKIGDAIFMNKGTTWSFLRLFAILKPKVRYEYNEMTTEFWFKPIERSSLDLFIMSFAQQLNTSLEDYLSANIWNQEVGGWIEFKYSGEKILLDKWYHITSTFKCGPKENFLKIYLNGNKVAERKSAAGEICKKPFLPEVWEFPFAEVVLFGSAEQAYFDELHVYNYARSDAEIWQDYAKEAGEPICYRESQCGGDGFIDEVFCSNEKTIAQTYRDHTCSNPGAQQASCSYQDSNRIMRTCNEQETCLAGRCVFQKPESTSRIKVSSRELLVNNEKFKIKGVGYQPIPIGYNYAYNFYEHPEVYNRDFKLLRKMGVNTIRTWNIVRTKEFLDAAWNNGKQPIYVVMGYWMNREGDDFGDPATRERYIKDFRDYVAKYKDHPAVLLWGIGNEDNFFYKRDVKDWYNLVNEMAKAAYLEEGQSYHPAAIINGGHANLGDSSKNADDASLNYIDIISAIVYPEGGAEDFPQKGCNFGNWFSEFEQKTKKPTYLAEYGADSWNALTEKEDQDMQAACVLSYTNEILSADVNLGGTIMAYSDEWWKAAGDSSKQDPGGWFTSSQPDGMGNEEYWGIVAIQKDPEWNNPDIILPKKAYYELQKIFKVIEFMRGDANSDGELDISDPIFILLYLFNGLPSQCLDALDSNDDGKVDISDAIYTLRFLFAGEGTIPSPFTTPGSDPTPDNLDCQFYPSDL